MPHTAISYSLNLVMTSLVISVLACWTGLELSCRVHAQRNGRSKSFWLGSGALVMGLGIWAMHYVGMLAMRTGAPVYYHWPTVLLSLFAAVVASALALYLVSRPTLSMWTMAAGGICMGGGIAAMHYIGMAALRMPCSFTYSRPLVALSLFLAVAISTVALRLCFHTRQDASLWSKTKIGSALLMGVAVPTMHYVGMAAMRMQPGDMMGPAPGTYPNVIQVSQLGAAALTGAACLCMSACFLFARLNRKTLAAQHHLELATNERDQLDDYQRRLVKAYSQNGVGAWEWIATTDTFSIDREMRRIYGWDNDTASRSHFLRIVHPDDQPLLAQRWQEALLSGTKYENEYRILHRDGAVRRCRSVATVNRNEDGSPASVLGMSWDVTAEHEQKAHYAELARRFYVTLEAIGEAVLAVDASQKIVYANPLACQLTGWSAEECLGRPLTEVFVAKDEATGRIRKNPVQRCIGKGGKLLSEDALLVSRNGALYNIQKHVNLTDDCGSAVLTFQDITAARQLKQELEHAASHDSLTGLPNRAAFLKRLRKVWALERADGRTHCLCLLDLDRFKLVNDTAGHLAGDTLLKSVVEVLRPLLGPNDYLARMGGDEFLLLLSDTGQNEANALARLLLQAVENFRFVWQNRFYSVTLSVGMVFFDRNSTSLEALTSQADVALYTCKRNGRNRIAAYEASIGEAAGNLQEMETASDIRSALEEDRFELHAQPIVPLRGAVSKDYFEILVRMRDRQGNLVSPGHFIPAAECFGIMQWIDRWVVRNALLARAEYADAAPDLHFAINLSADSLSDPSLWEFVEEQFRVTGVSPDSVTFEVTESGLIRNYQVASSFLNRAHAAGCRIALDDFGTGMSSLSYLKQFPPDIIKIDGSFVRKLRGTPLDQSIVQAISQIAHAMGANTVAECAEDLETVELLTGLGVDYVQGWATGKPEPLLPMLQRRVVPDHADCKSRFRQILDDTSDLQPEMAVL